METTVVVVDEDAQTEFVEVEVFAEGKGLANQVGATLAQGVVEALNVRSFARLFAHRAMTLGRDNRTVGSPKVGVADRPFAIVGWQRVPELAACLSRAITHGKANDTACLSLNRNPDPHLVPLVANK